jgi:hypothetical protein
VTGTLHLGCPTRTLKLTWPSLRSGPRSLMPVVGPTTDNQVALAVTNYRWRTVTVVRSRPRVLTHGGSPPVKPQFFQGAGVSTRQCTTRQAFGPSEESLAQHCRFGSKSPWRFDRTVPNQNFPTVLECFKLGARRRWWRAPRFRRANACCDQRRLHAPTVRRLARVRLCTMTSSAHRPTTKPPEPEHDVLLW